MGSMSLVFGQIPVGQHLYMQTQLKSFAQFTKESAQPQKTIAFSVIRANCPGLGEVKQLNALCEVGTLNKCGYRAYVSSAVSKPLKHSQKVKTLREMFANHARNIVHDEVASVVEAAAKLYAQEFTDVILCAPADMITLSETLLKKYNGVAGQHGFYNFRSIRVVPDGRGAEQHEAEAMISAASSNDLNAFAAFLPEGYAPEVLFNEVRVGLGLKESTRFRKHIQLDSVGERREAYVNGDLFAVGDDVVLKKTQEVAKIVHLGSNYLLVEQAAGKRSRVWLDAVEPLEEKLTNDDSLPFAVNQYAPLQRKPLGLISRPLSALRSRQ